MVMAGLLAACNARPAGYQHTALEMTLSAPGLREVDAVAVTLTESDGTSASRTYSISGGRIDGETLVATLPDDLSGSLNVDAMALDRDGNALAEATADVTIVPLELARVTLSFQTSADGGPDGAPDSGPDGQPDGTPDLPDGGGVDGDGIVVVDQAPDQTDGPAPDGDGGVDMPPDLPPDQPPPCDTNGDGLIDNPTCVTNPTILRFVNTSRNDIYNVTISGGTNPAVVGLGPGQVTVIGPVQAGLLDYTFTEVTTGESTSGEVVTNANQRTSIVAYRGPGNALGNGSAEQLQPGGCGSDSGQVAIGQMTSQSPNPVPVWYSSSGLTGPWNMPISPGLNTGQIFGDGCWTGNLSLNFAAGANQAIKYAAVTFTGGLTYQLLMADNQIIRIDNLDRVSTFAAQ
jgi:hypothetical protein